MSALVDFTIGLSFIYLLFSLAVTGATELFSALLASRGRMLKRGILRLLEDDQLLKAFYNHSLIKSLGRRSSSMPSYIPARTFALVLMDLVGSGREESTSAGEKGSDAENAATPAHKIDFEGFSAKVQKRRGPMSEALRVLIADADLSAGTRRAERYGEGWAATDARLEGLRSGIETWFNDTMERTSGWYKRRTQLVNLVIAAVITVSFNADTLVIGQRLWTDAGLRSAVVAQAEAYAKANAEQPTSVPAVNGDVVSALAVPPPPCPPYEACGLDAAAERFDESIGQLRTLALPLGWGTEAGEGTGPLRERILRHLPGWLLTILAISIGAPFWFDTLNRFIAIRSAGKAPEEKQKSPKQFPLPDAGGETHATKEVG